MTGKTPVSSLLLDDCLRNPMVQVTRRLHNFAPSVRLLPPSLRLLGEDSAQALDMAATALGVATPPY